MCKTKTCRGVLSKNLKTEESEKRELIASVLQMRDGVRFVDEAHKKHKRKTNMCC